MDSRYWKRFFAVAAVSTLAAPGLALADPTCAYVIGQVDGQTVTTPAIPIVVPASDAEIQPVRVHLDELEQNIIGYSVRIPGVDAGTEGQPVFVPGISETIPSVSATLPQLDFNPQRCVNIDGVSTPAVPVYIPATALTTPGTTMDVPVIAFNILGHAVTTQGYAITLDSKTLVIPELDFIIPGIPVGTPDQTIVIDVNATVEMARYLAPPSN